MKTRPNTLQFWSLPIRRRTFLKYIMFAYIRISRLKSCKMLGQEDYGSVPKGKKNSFEIDSTIFHPLIKNNLRILTDPFTFL